MYGKFPDELHTSRSEALSLPSWISAYSLQKRYIMAGVTSLLFGSSDMGLKEHHVVFVPCNYSFIVQGSNQAPDSLT